MLKPVESFAKVTIQYVLLFISLLLISTQPLFAQPELDREYFMEIALGSEHGNGAAEICRWNDEIRIQLIGGPSNEDMQQVHQITQEISQLTGLTVIFDDENPSMSLYFIKSNEFHTVFPEYDLANVNGFANVWFTTSAEIVRAKVLIATEVQQQLRNHIIREEITQAIGLMKDSFHYPDSIFYQPWSTVQAYSDQDRLLLQTLYSDSIQPGMNREEVMRALPDTSETYAVDYVTGHTTDLHRLNWQAGDLGGKEMNCRFFEYHEHDQGYYATRDFVNLFHDDASGTVTATDGNGVTMKARYSIENGQYLGVAPFRRYAQTISAIHGNDPGYLTFWQNGGLNRWDCYGAIPTGTPLACEDTGIVGDGWGWNGVESCRTEPLTFACVDTDGDGLGWNGVSECQMQPHENQLDNHSCIDSDGDGWGWDGEKSCLATAIVSACIDTDGDGWGWNGHSSCKP